VADVIRRNDREAGTGPQPARGIICWVLGLGPKVPTTAVIAIVDDDQSVREALMSFVRSLGYAAIAFESADDFLKSPQLHSLSCLIADVQMPGMTGIELHDRLLALGASLPTILVTAYPEESARERALRSGVIGYLAKPFSDAALLACLRSCLGPGPDEPKRA
jgi:FixJ family two-component response regulator